ncbi:MAG TPA: hypothetical protein VEH76_08760 [Methylocystis sp.]|nr:hypothetical protein [Methylocystis sp.]
MRTLLLGTLLLTSLGAPAWGAVDLENEKSDGYELTLRAPEAALAIEPLKAELLRRFDERTKNLKDLVREACKTDEASHSPYLLSMNWRVTYENPKVLSLSGKVYSEDCKHAYDDFETIVWDKQALRETPLTDIFLKDKQADALRDIALYASRAFLKSRRGGDLSDSYYAVEDHISAKPLRLGHYALTYAKGEELANGIVLLWGAGEAWPRVVDDVRISVPAAVFFKYLAPEWTKQFK